ncbi:hypothetical protein ACWDOP_10085 [Nocardia sp. NPDC003693]
MSNTSAFRRPLGLGLAGLAVATGVTVVLANPSAPEATAAVDNITISGSDHKVGQTYTLHADLSGASFGLLVYWKANGQAITSPAAQVPWPAYNTSADWTPRTAGAHTITLTQGSSTKSLVVNVTDGWVPTTTPPTTTVPPTTTEPPVTTTPPVTTEPPVTTTPPVTTEPPVTTTPPVTTEPPVTTTPPPVTTTPPTTTEPPVTTTPPTTTKPAGSGSSDLLPF